MCGASKETLQKTTLHHSAFCVLFSVFCFLYSVFCEDHLTDVYGKKYDRSFIVFASLFNLSIFLQNRI